jgi:hypothetical protein
VPGEGEGPMGVVVAWFVTIVLVLGLFMGLYHVGVDVAATAKGVAHSVENFLNTPLAVF